MFEGLARVPLFLGDPAGEFKQRIKLPAAFQEKFAVFAQDANGISPSPIPFRLSDLRNVIEVEPNDTHQQATPAELPETYVPPTVECVSGPTCP